MYIRRKVFSVLDTEEGERLFSTTDYILDQREFGKDDRKKGESRKRRTKLEDVQSHRGLGRALFLGLPSGGITGALGGYVGKKYANDLDEQGASDAEIKKKSSERAAMVGAGLGAAGGLVGAPHLAGANKVLVPIGAAGMAGLGAYLGARKNAEVRLAKRREMDRDRD